MPTIKDVSKKCGVSPSTVSKVLNGYSEIGEETAALVRAAAEELGYHPNAAARSLKTNRSGTIGVLLVDNECTGLTHSYFASVLEGFKVEVEKAGFDITFISENISAQSMTFLEHCHYRNCDGVMVAFVDYNLPAVRELVMSSMPLVTIDHTFDNRAAVISDNIQGVRDLVNYIYSQGHRKIAFIYGDKDSSTTKRRVASFNRTCAELGIPQPPEYLRPAIYHDASRSAMETAELLSLTDPPTCIMYPDDLAYIGGMNMIEDMGLSIPEDVSAAGYDGTLLSQVLRPRMTTVRQDTARIGAEAAKTLITAIQNPRTFIPQQILVPSELLPGGTVKKIDA